MLSTSDVHIPNLPEAFGGVLPVIAIGVEDLFQTSYFRCCLGFSMPIWLA